MMQGDLRKQANLRLLQRTCSSDLTDILATATHVVLYEFSQSTQNWTKCNTEGSLFLAASQKSSSAGEYYQLIILNRNSTDDFVCAVDSTLQLQHEPPYMILKKTDAIIGIWFHNDDERVALNTVLQATVERLRSQPPAPAPAPTPTPQQPMQQQPKPQPAAHQPAQQSIDATATSMAAMSLKTVLGIDTSSSPSTASRILPPQQLVAAAAAASVTANSTTSSPASAAAAASAAPPALDKKSLQLTLLSLLQDDRFLDLVHSQYLKVVRTRAAAANNRQQQQQQQQQPPQSNQNGGPSSS